MKLLVGSCAGRRGLVVLVVHALFDFPSHVVLGVVEFTDAPAQSPHQLRNLPATKQQEDHNRYQDHFLKTKAAHKIDLGVKGKAI